MLGITGMILPLALAVFIVAVVLLAQGIRKRHIAKIAVAAALFLLLATGYLLLLRFITSM